MMALNGLVPARNQRDSQVKILSMPPFKDDKIMNLDEKTYVQTFQSLLEDTPNIRKYLEEQRKINPNNYRPWVLKIINFFKIKST